MAGKQNRRGWGWVAKQRSGRYLSSYVGPDSLRHYAPSTFSAKIDAEGWLATERRLIEVGEWTPPAVRKAETQARAITLGEYLDRWIEQRTLKPRTKQGYEDLARLHIKPKLGAIALGHMTSQVVRTWYAGLGNEHPRRNSHAYGLLHAVCATAVTDQLLSANPCAIERAMNPKRKKDPVIPTIAQLGAIADKIQPERMKALVLLSAWCGVRWGEVIALQRNDISEGCEVLNVRRAVTHRGECRVDTTKSGVSRLVVIPPHIRPAIQDHLDRHVAKHAAAQLFPADRGGCHLNDRVFRTYFDKALKDVGLEHVTTHGLRHFAGTQTARVGNLVESMARLGHSTSKAALMYQQVVSGRDAEIAAALSALAEAEAEDQAAPSSALCAILSHFRRSRLCWYCLSRVRR